VADGLALPRGSGGLNLHVLAVGKAGRGPEGELAERYAGRAAKAGRSLGLTRVEVREIAEGRGARRSEDEAAEILAKRPPGVLVALDERGECVSSEGFAARLQGWLDRGEPAVTFAIGGADGHGRSLREAAHEVVSLGPLTLPHLLARVILLEQVYRAVTIRLGHPYHRA
jgi:23S rRNA (pseudouridine1915-N3)-methyltransferase